MKLFTQHLLRLIQEVISLWLERLSVKQRLVITSRYGLDGDAPQTLEAVGRNPALNVTRERIRQLQFIALDRLRGIANDQRVSKEVLMDFA